MIRDEKFPQESIEEAKSALRLEETMPEADACLACREARAQSGDVTNLCKEHLRRIYGV